MGTTLLLYFQVTGVLWSQLYWQLQERVCFLAWPSRICHAHGCSNWFSDRQVISQKKKRKKKWDFYWDCWEKSTLFYFSHLCHDRMEAWIFIPYCYPKGNERPGGQRDWVMISSCPGPILGSLRLWEPLSFYFKSCFLLYGIERVLLLKYSV